jgi:hypothetical protein
MAQRGMKIDFVIGVNFERERKNGWTLVDDSLDAVLHEGNIEIEQ